MREATSFDWETLIPVIFFILYGIAQFLGAKKKQDTVEEEGDEPEFDPMERARQIREEIRRKIEERKQATGGRPDYDPTMPETRQQPHQPAQPAPSRIPEPKPVVVRRTDSVMAQQAAMQKRLEEQRKRLEHARRKQEEARLQARKMEKAAGVRSRSLLEESKEPSHAAASGLRNQILSGLSDRGGLRKAVLYREILDPPLGLR